MKFLFDLLDNLKWATKEDKEKYTFYYYDRLKKVTRGFKFNDIKKILNLYLLINKEGKDVYISLTSLMEIKENNIIIWKR